MRPVLPAVRPFRAAGACLFAAGCLGLAGRARSGSAAARTSRTTAGWPARGSTSCTSTLLGDGRLAHHRGLPLPGRRAAADRRQRRERAQGDRRLGHDDRAAGCARAPSECARRSRGGARRATSSAELDTAEITRGHGRSSGPAPSASRTSTEDAEPAAEPERRPGARGPRPQEPEPRLAEDPETDEPGVMRGAREVAPEDLTPQGRLRRSVTDAPEFVWSCPTRASSPARAPRPAGPTPRGRRRSPPSWSRRSATSASRRA